MPNDELASTTQKPRILRPSGLYLVLLVVAPLSLLFLVSDQSERAAWLSATTSVVTMVFLWVTLELQRHQLDLQRQTIVATNKAVRDNADATVKTADEMQRQREQMEMQLNTMHDQLAIMKAAYLAPNLPVMQLSIGFSGGELQVQGRNAGTGKAKILGLWLVTEGERLPLASGLADLCQKFNANARRLVQSGGTVGGIWNADGGTEIVILLEFNHTGRPTEGQRKLIAALEGVRVEIEYSDLVGVEKSVASAIFPLLEWRPLVS